MLSIDLKTALFVLLLLLAVLGWALWRAARQQSLFERQFQAVWGVAPFGVVLLSGWNRPIFANRVARRLLTLADDATLTQAASLQAITNQLKPRVAAQRFSQTISAEETVDVWCGSFGAAQLMILRDLSAERRQEQETHRLWSGISHELRTPMTSILSHLEVIRLPNTSEEVRDQSLTVVQQQAERLSQLVQNSLTLGRLKSTAGSDHILVDLILIAEEAMAEMILLAEKQDNQMSLVCMAPVLHVYGNGDQLKQVLVNLLDNALKYCLAGDSITVELTEHDDRIECAVRDTGPGIEPAHLSRLTEQFYRVRRDVPGSGLGLTIVGEIVEQHGGKLTIRSKTDGPARGTTIAFDLPKAPPVPTD